MKKFSCAQTKPYPSAESYSYQTIDKIYARYSPYKNVTCTQDQDVQGNRASTANDLRADIWLTRCINMLSNII